MKKDLARNYLGTSSVWLGVILASCSLAVLALASCRKPAAGPPPERPAPRVTVALASGADVPVYLDEIGRTVAVEVVSIVPQVAGKIITASVQDGAMVKKGDLLFEIDPRPFQAALALAKATLAQDKAQMGLAKIEFGRVGKLIASGAVSQLEFDQAQSAVEVAQAKVAAGEAAVQTGELNLEYAKIYAPITGRAGVRMADAGNVVKDNGPPMLVLQQIDPIQAEFTVTENDLGPLRGYLADQGLDLAAAAQRLTALVGGLLTLHLFGQEASLYAFIGLFMLMGIVKKNGIMIVDFAIQRIADGKTAEEAIHQASMDRFRPILMTTLAAVMGAVPIAMGYGADGVSRRPLGLVIVGGLLVSQLITLFVTPCLYLYMEVFQEKVLNRIPFFAAHYEGHAESGHLEDLPPGGEDNGRQTGAPCFPE